jgi:hypothetical protein
MKFWGLKVSVVLLATSFVTSFVPMPTTSIQQQLYHKATTRISASGSKPVTVSGPPKETKPDYENIHGPFGKALDRVLLTMFRTALADKVGVDSNLPKVR